MICMATTFPAHDLKFHFDRQTQKIHLICKRLYLEQVRYVRYSYYPCSSGALGKAVGSGPWASLDTCQASGSRLRAPLKIHSTVKCMIRHANNSCLSDYDEYKTIGRSNTIVSQVTTSKSSGQRSRRLSYFEKDNTRHSHPKQNHWTRNKGS